LNGEEFSFEGQSVVLRKGLRICYKNTDEGVGMGQTEQTANQSIDGPVVVTELDRDLGFGSVASSRRNIRLLNRDGSFNVKVLHGPVWDRLISYHRLLTISWTNFYLVVAAGYLVLNTIFAAIYVACGSDSLTGQGPGTQFQRAFFFSVETMATIGYGNVYPGNVASNVVMTIESMVGLLLFAIGTGLVFARFSRPTADILYARHAVIGPYKDGMDAFKFRIVNRKQSQLVNVDAVVTHSRFEEGGSTVVRKFYQLALERNRVVFFPLNWTIVHPIDSKSPLYGWTPDKLRAADAEFYVSLTAVDETFAQTVHSRSSYTMDDVKCGENYRMMYDAVDGEFVLDLEMLDKTEKPTGSY
jgi:inward rectifier potassium channel